MATRTKQSKQAGTVHATHKPSKTRTPRLTPAEELLSTKDLADELGITVCRVLQLVTKGRFKPVTLADGRVLEPSRVGKTHIVPRACMASALDRKVGAAGWLSRPVKP